MKIKMEYLNLKELIEQGSTEIEGCQIILVSEDAKQ